MSCPYITGLEDNNVDLVDAENLSSRAAARLATPQRRLSDP